MFRFDDFLLVPAERQLRRGDVPLDVNGRYLDALVLLVEEQGRLVTKDRFMDEVWRGVPVTDEALTQCIRALRRQLGDDAVRPRFIETVPKHGYRFIAEVECGGAVLERRTERRQDERAGVLRLALGGTLGGVVAGALGGLFYGFAGSFQPLAPGVSAISVLLVLLCLTVGIALLGSAGVACGIAAGLARGDRRWSIVGAAAGGLLVGAVVKLLGTDAFNLLFGASPGNITGAAEGVALGGAVGLAAWLATGRSEGLSIRKGVGVAALIGAVTGVTIVLLGGRLMLGSLDQLARHLPGSRLQLDSIGGLLGEQGLGPLTAAVTGGIEAALFAAGVVGGILFVQQQAADRG